MKSFVGTSSEIPSPALISAKDCELASYQLYIFSGAGSPARHRFYRLRRGTG